MDEYTKSIFYHFVDADLQQIVCFELYSEFPMHPLLFFVLIKSEIKAALKEHVADAGKLQTIILSMIPMPRQTYQMPILIHFSFLLQNTRGRLISEKQGILAYSFIDWISKL